MPEINPNYVDGVPMCSRECYYCEDCRVKTKCVMEGNLRVIMIGYSLCVPAVRLLKEERNKLKADYDELVENYDGLYKNFKSAHEDIEDKRAEIDRLKLVIQEAIDVMDEEPAKEALKEAIKESKNE